MVLGWCESGNVRCSFLVLSLPSLKPKKLASKIPARAEAGLVGPLWLAAGTDWLVTITCFDAASLQKLTTSV